MVSRRCVAQPIRVFYSPSPPFVRLRILFFRKLRNAVDAVIWQLRAADGGRGPVDQAQGTSQSINSLANMADSSLNAETDRFVAKCFIDFSLFHLYVVVSHNFVSY